MRRILERRHAEKPLRLFVAIDLDDPARDLVAQAIARLEAAGLRAKYAPREKWHATLAFLGPTTLQRYAEVRSALEQAANRCDPFDVTLDIVGAFPSKTRPRVVWVGASAPQPGYVSCAGSVRESMTALGFTFDLEAVPHVTVCRLKDHSSPIPDVRLEDSATFRVPALTLYESLPAGGTTRYAVREMVRLRAR